LLIINFDKLSVKLVINVTKLVRPQR